MFDLSVQTPTPTSINLLHQLVNFFARSEQLLHRLPCCKGAWNRSALFAWEQPQPGVTASGDTTTSQAPLSGLTHFCVLALYYLACSLKLPLSRDYINLHAFYVNPRASKMASSNNTTTFGATIVPTPQRTKQDLTLPVPIADSPALTPTASREELTQVPTSSPFYQHPADSFERGHSRQTSKVDVPLNEKDLEAGVQTPLQPGEPFTGKVSVDCNKECKMWPSKQTLMQSKMAEKKRKRNDKICGGCTGPVMEFWGRFTKRQKLSIKIAFGLFLVGVIVAIAVGITVVVNGTVYSSEGQTHKIPDPNSN